MDLENILHEVLHSRRMEKQVDEEMKQSVKEMAKAEKQKAKDFFEKAEDIEVAYLLSVGAPKIKHIVRKTTSTMEAFRSAKGAPVKEWHRAEKAEAEARKRYVGLKHSVDMMVRCDVPVNKVRKAVRVCRRPNHGRLKEVTAEVLKVQREEEEGWKRTTWRDEDEQNYLSRRKKFSQQRNAILSVAYPKEKQDAPKTRSERGVAKELRGELIRKKLCRPGTYGQIRPKKSTMEKIELEVAEVIISEHENRQRTWVQRRAEYLAEVMQRRGYLLESDKKEIDEMFEVELAAEKEKAAKKLGMRRNRKTNYHAKKTKDDKKGGEGERHKETMARPSTVEPIIGRSEPLEEAVLSDGTEAGAEEAEATTEIPQDIEYTAKKNATSVEIEERNAPLQRTVSLGALQGSSFRGLKRPGSASDRSQIMLLPDLRHALEKEGRPVNQPAVSETALQRIESDPSESHEVEGVGESAAATAPLNVVETPADETSGDEEEEVSLHNHESESKTVSNLDEEGTSTYLSTETTSSAISLVKASTRQKHSKEPHPRPPFFTVVASNRWQKKASVGHYKNPAPPEGTEEDGGLWSAIAVGRRLAKDKKKQIAIDKFFGKKSSTEIHQVNLTHTLSGQMVGSLRHWLEDAKSQGSVFVRLAQQKEEEKMADVAKEAEERKTAFGRAKELRGWRDRRRPSTAQGHTHQHREDAVYRPSSSQSVREVGKRTQPTHAGVDDELADTSATWAHDVFLKSKAKVDDLKKISKTYNIRKQAYLLHEAMGAIQTRRERQNAQIHTRVVMEELVTQSRQARTSAEDMAIGRS